MLAIVKSFEEQQAELISTNTKITIFLDYKNLEYFKTTKRLSSRQARQNKFMSSFNYQITYRPGKINPRTDALTRRLQDIATKEERSHRDQTIIPPDIVVKLSKVEGYEVFPYNLVAAATSIEEDNTSILESIRKVATSNADYQEIVRRLREGVDNLELILFLRRNQIKLHLCELKDGLIYIGGRLQIPDDAASKVKVLQ